MNTDQTTPAPVAPTEVSRDGVATFKIAPNTWGDKKFKLKNKFGHLNDDDLHFETGKEEEMIDRLRAKLNKSEAEMHALINAL